MGTTGRIEIVVEVDGIEVTPRLRTDFDCGCGLVGYAIGMAARSAQDLANRTTKQLRDAGEETTAKDFLRGFLEGFKREVAIEDSWEHISLPPVTGERNV